MALSKEEWLEQLQPLLHQPTRKRRRRRNAIGSAEELVGLATLAADLDAARPDTALQEIQEAIKAAKESLQACAPLLDAAETASSKLSEKAAHLKGNTMWKGLRKASEERTLKRRTQVRTLARTVRQHLRRLALVLPPDNPADTLRDSFAAGRYARHDKLLRMELPAMGREYTALRDRHAALAAQAAEAESLLDAQFGESLEVPLPGVSVAIGMERLEATGSASPGKPPNRDEIEATLNLVQSPLSSFIQRQLEAADVERFEDLSPAKQAALESEVEAHADALVGAMADSKTAKAAVRQTQVIRSLLATVKGGFAVGTLVASAGVDVTGYIRLAAALHDIALLIHKGAKTLDKRAAELRDGIDAWENGDLVRETGRATRELRIYMEGLAVATLSANPLGVATAALRACMDATNDHAHLRELVRQHGSATAALHLNFQSAYAGLLGLMQMAAQFEEWAKDKEDHEVEVTFLKLFARTKRLSAAEVRANLTVRRVELQEAVEALTKLGAALSGDEGHLFLQMEAGSVLRSASYLNKTYTTVHAGVQMLSGFGSFGAESKQTQALETAQTALKHLEEAGEVLAGVGTELEELGSALGELVVVGLAEALFAAL
jgi:hypothetical protein